MAARNQTVFDGFHESSSKSQTQWCPSRARSRPRTRDHADNEFKERNNFLAYHGVVPLVGNFREPSCSWSVLKNNFIRHFEIKQPVYPPSALKKCRLQIPSRSDFVSCPSASSPSKLCPSGCSTITANPLNWSRSYTTLPTSLTRQTWIEQLEQDGAQHKLKYIFLANDVILQVRKKGTSLLDAFRGSLPRAFEHMRDRCAANDIAQVWRQPRVCVRACV